MHVTGRDKCSQAAILVRTAMYEKKNSSKGQRLRTLFAASNYAQNVLVWIIMGAGSTMSIVHPQINRSQFLSLQKCRLHKSIIRHENNKILCITKELLRWRGIRTRNSQEDCRKGTYRPFECLLSRPPIEPFLHSQNS